MTAGTDEEVARLTYELERVEEGRRRLRAALAEQRTAADAFAARAEADVIAAAGGSTGDVVAAHGDLCQSLRSRLDATSAEEDARAHDLRATCAALQLSAALASTEYRSATYPNSWNQTGRFRSGFTRSHGQSEGSVWRISSVCEPISESEPIPNPEPILGIAQ